MKRIKFIASALLLTATALFGGCNNEQDDSRNNAKSQQEIVALLQNSRQTMTQSSTLTVVTERNRDSSLIYPKLELAFDLSLQKCYSAIIADDGKVWDFNYLDGLTQYRFKEARAREKYKIALDGSYWSGADLNSLLHWHTAYENFPLWHGDFADYEWTSDYEIFTGVSTDSCGNVEKYTLTLDGNNRFVKIKWTTEVKESGSNYTYTEESTISHSADLRFPTGFNKDDFPARLTNGHGTVDCSLIPSRSFALNRAAQYVLKYNNVLNSVYLIFYNGADPVLSFELRSSSESGKLAGGTYASNAFLMQYQNVIDGKIYYFNGEDNINNIVTVSVENDVYTIVFDFNVREYEAAAVNGKITGSYKGPVIVE